MSQTTGRVLVYGGKGALGSSIVSYFKRKNWWVGSVDLNENSDADANIIVGREADLMQQEKEVLQSISAALSGNKLDAVICVAGGWAGGNAAKDLAKNGDLMWRQSVWSSLVSAAVAAHHLKEGGLISLAGAKAALDPTPTMLGYGIAKAAVHSLTKSLACKTSGLPANTLSVAILPVTLDTPMNRKWMPTSDHTTWTPLSFIAELLYNWTIGKDRPANGSLVTLITSNSQTNVIPV